LLLLTILKYTYTPYASDNNATHPRQNVLQYGVLSSDPVAAGQSDTFTYCRLLATLFGVHCD
jgi:hypothetical protein